LQYDNNGVRSSGNGAFKTAGETLLKYSDSWMNWKNGRLLEYSGRCVYSSHSAVQGVQRSYLRQDVLSECGAGFLTAQAHCSRGVRTSFSLITSRTVKPRPECLKRVLYQVRHCLSPDRVSNATYCLESIPESAPEVAWHSLTCRFEGHQIGPTLTRARPVADVHTGCGL
jgi:hypothetical protein